MLLWITLFDLTKWILSALFVTGGGPAAFIVDTLWIAIDPTGLCRWTSAERLGEVKISNNNACCGLYIICMIQLDQVRWTTPKNTACSKLNIQQPLTASGDWLDQIR